jgi:hypothetical protein
MAQNVPNPPTPPPIQRPAEDAQSAASDLYQLNEERRRRSEELEAATRRNNHPGTGQSR